MKYATVCSGIEACTVAWKPLGWEAQWFSEIDKFPSAVLAHHYPDTPNLGDMTKIHEHETFKKSVGSVDLICGGTPCQSFSIAGLRKGLDDPRGNLALTYLGLVDKLRPEWVIWENVPGVLSSDGGRDFGTFLAALGQLGYGWAYRILDAQYFGVPQRRRRVFVVGHSSGDWQRAAAVLFERKSLSRDPKPGRKKRKEITSYTPSSIGGYREGCGTLRANGGDLGGGSESLIIGIDKELNTQENQMGTLTANDYKDRVCVYLSNAEGSHCLPLRTASNGKSVNNQTPILYSIMPQNSGKDYKAKPSTVEQPLMAGMPGGNQGGDVLLNGRARTIRRLTPIECERLQGFPDNYTQIPYRNKPTDKCPDRPRYKGLGNSMAVPVMRWIGERIDFVESIINES